MLSANRIRVPLVLLALTNTCTTACTTGAIDPAGSPAAGEVDHVDEPSDSGTCTAATCPAPSTDGDGVKNGNETDIDCGGPGGLPRCADQKQCKLAMDCTSNICIEGICRPVIEHDGVQNGGETDIDCGGPHPDKCGTDEKCLIATDCKSAICIEASKKCAAPAIDDKVKNGAETDVDCGGPEAPKCKSGLGCNVHSDCVSDGCGDDKTCAAGASCTQLEGGQTCGPIESLTKQEDCCARAKVGPYTVDKYLVTAGRMRAFLQRLDGNVRSWAATLPPTKWNQAWTARLPNSIDGTPGDLNNASSQLGPYFGKRSCETGYHTGHTFWTSESYGDKKDFPQNVLDTKALNCVPWWLLAALCVFDGGHLLTEPELHAAYTNNGTTTYPWGAIGTYTTSAVSNYAIGLWGYMTPNPPASARHDADGFLDAAYYVAPPGRRPAGYNATGAADLVGNLLEWVGDSERQFVWKGSFENHGREADVLESPIDNDPYLVMRTPQLPWKWTDVVAMSGDPENENGYYAIGGRCGY